MAPLVGATWPILTMASPEPLAAGAAALAGVNERVMWVGKPGAPKPPVVVPLTAAQQASFERGRTIFNSLCAACHQPHGYGLDGRAPRLVDSEWVTGKPDVVARIVMNGLGGPVKVGGRTWDLSMPPMAQLNDEDLARLGYTDDPSAGKTRP